jgi:hypothetical protein
MRALLLLAALALSACHPCVEVCNDQVSAYQACLSEWDLGWVDLGAQDASDWWEQCSDDQEVWADGLQGEEASRASAQCTGLRDRLRGAQTCEARWDVLVDYGSF